MKRTTLTLAAMLLGTTAMAQAVGDDIVAELTKQGYTDIEVTTRATTLEVEAIKDGQEREIVYDLATGDVLSDETELADADGSGSGAVSGGDAASAGSGAGGSGAGGSGGGGSGGGSNDQAMLDNAKFDYLNGGQETDISFG